MNYLYFYPKKILKSEKYGFIEIKGYKLPRIRSITIGNVIGHLKDLSDVQG